MAKYRDFDRFFQEAKSEPVVLRYQGETHHLPSSLPVATVLMLRRLEKQQGQVSDETIIKLFQTVFGPDRYAKWVQGGMLLDQMIALLGWALEVYGLAQEQTAEEAAQDPTEATPE
jgi:hypothetical protein